MPSDLVAALEATVNRFLSLAVEDEPLRSALHQLALSVAKATEPPAASAAAVPPVPVVATPEPSLNGQAEEKKAAPEKIIAAAPAPAEPAEPLPELTFGRFLPVSAPAAPAHAGRPVVSSDIDRSQVESRCRLKAEGSRWAATRRRLLTQGAAYSAEIAPKDADIIARAKATPDCFLWMCHPTSPSPTDLGLYENVASCFDNAAELLAMIRRIQEQPELLQGEFEQCLDLLAEVQSALRVGIEALGAKPDSDQWLIYQWLKFTGHESQIFIQRYMRLDDPADPQKWPDLASRIEAADLRIQEGLKKDKQRGKLLGKIRYKASQISPASGSEVEQWEEIIPLIDELVTNGLKPSNVELREILIPAIETLPDIPDLPKNVGLVFREIDRHLATVPPPEIKSLSSPSAEVQEVAQLLKGQSMVVIGGERRPASYAALKEAFQLAELIWIETREHESISGFEPYIARPDVAVVILAIRWSSHSHGDAKLFCERYGKPLVRLPGGYNPNQVAAQILQQCSDQLAAT